MSRTINPARSRSSLLAHPFALSILTGLLLVSAFPKVSLGFVAWFALVPLLWAIEQSRNRGSVLLCGLLAGSL